MAGLGSGPARWVRFPAMPTRRRACALCRPPSSAPSTRPSREDTYVLAVDLGTGGPKVAVLVRDRPHRRPRLRGGGRRPDRRRRRRAVAPGVVGRHRGRRPGVPWPTAAWRPSGSSASAAPRSGRAPCPSTTPGSAIGPAIIWMDSRGARAVRETVRGTLNVQGYSASKLARWVRRTGGIPSLSGKDPVGHIHFLREQRPDVYAATAVFLEPVDYLNLRLTGLARASHDSITVHWVTDNRDIGADRLRRRPRSSWPASSGPRCPTSSRRAACSAGWRPTAAAELGLLPRHAGRRRHRGPALGRRRLGSRGGLRRATSTSAPRAGSAATSRSRRPTP